MLNFTGFCWEKMIHVHFGLRAIGFNIFYNSRHMKSIALSSYPIFKLKQFRFFTRHCIPTSSNAVAKLSLNSKCEKSSSVHTVDDNRTILEKLVDKTPPRLKPYLRLMRIDKPTGSLLLLWPCYWSLALATSPGTLPDPFLVALFGFGALLMRGAGCTINDLWDKEIDSKVERTRHRPLASGELSILDAWMFLGGQLSLSLLVLLQLNWYSVVLGASSLGLVVTYPLMKRITYWPQLMLGLTFNWGALLGWSAVHGSCDWMTVLPLYGACISWTLIYDTIYAHQDKVDDVLIKIKSTAIMFGDKTKYWLTGFSFSMVSCLIVAGYSMQQTWPFYASVGLTGMMLCSQISSLNINDPQSCWRAFKSNQRIGWIMFVGIVAGTLFKKTKKSDDGQRKFVLPVLFS